MLAYRVYMYSLRIDLLKSICMEISSGDFRGQSRSIVVEEPRTSVWIEGTTKRSPITFSTNPPPFLVYVNNVTTAVRRLSLDDRVINNRYRERYNDFLYRQRLLLFSTVLFYTK